jgi:hypothetical protein
MQLLRRIAHLDIGNGVTLHYLNRGTWAIGSRDGYTANERTFDTLVKGGTARYVPGSHPARIEATDRARAGDAGGDGSGYVNAG